MIKYDANLLSLAKPEEGVLTATGKALKSASDWYWESRLNQVKERLANEQANGVEINNDFAKKNNAIDLKRNELRFINDSIKNQQDQITLGTMMQTQSSAIAKAAAEAKEAQSRASFADAINQSQVNQIKANTANTRADTNARKFEHEEKKKNLDAFYSYGIPALMKAKGDLGLFFEDMFKKPEDYDKIINDPNTPSENKKLASAEKEKIIRAIPGVLKEMSNLANINYKQSRADKIRKESLGDIMLGFKNLDVKQKQDLSYISQMQTRFKLLEEKLYEIDPNFGWQGYISAEAWKKFANNETRAVVESDIKALRTHAIRASGNKILKQELEMLNKIYDDPYKFLGNRASFNVLKNAIAVDVISRADGLLDSSNVSSEGDRSQMQYFYDKTRDFFDKYLYSSQNGQSRTQNLEYLKKNK
ncbi:hypothetical protein FU454_08810 [Campylobacter jejuni]|nr:hypothetical protein [Campylobacter jejuni]ECP8882524.1 hypothetical protein [Campylobacter jejuni]ECP9441157.1 hypothetical protein [Campylobacter jejuni]HED7208679.1 hypothetical protein [Campylobacter jejuni]